MGKKRQGILPLFALKKKEELFGSKVRENTLVGKKTAGSGPKREKEEADSSTGFSRGKKRQGGARPRKMKSRVVDGGRG